MGGSTIKQCQLLAQVGFALCGLDWTDGMGIVMSIGPEVDLDKKKQPKLILKSRMSPFYLCPKL